MVPVQETAVGDSVTSDSVLCFVTWLRNGQKDLYALEEHPVVTYDGGVLRLVTKKQEMEYQADSVHMFTLEKDKRPVIVPVGISQAESAGCIKLTAGSVELQHCRPGSKVRIVTAGGALLETRQAGNDGRVVISLSHYPKGTYVVKSETITRKIIRK